MQSIIWGTLITIFTKSGSFFFKKKLLPCPIDKEDAAQLEWVMIPITSPDCWDSLSLWEYGSNRWHGSDDIYRFSSNLGWDIVWIFK